MLTRILRERKQQTWNARRKAMDRKAKLEKKLGKTTKAIEPDDWVNTQGVQVGVHRCRGRNQRLELRFEFYRKDPHRGRVSDFGLGDLQALIDAVLAAKAYAGKQH